MLSPQLQQGKAAEHLVCADLILQGYNAFLSDQGLPYDLIVDAKGRLLRGQVKSSMVARDFPKSKQVYRFSMRCSMGKSRLVSAENIDFLAFVALDRKVIAYLPIEELTRPDGKMISIVEMRTRSIVLVEERIYSSGFQRLINYGRHLEDHSSFERIAEK